MFSSKVSIITISIFIGTNLVNATEYSPINGGNIVLNNGDSVIYNNSSNTSAVTAINVPSASDSLTINGSANVNIVNGGQAQGIYLANGKVSDLGSGSEINVNGMNGTVTGLYVRKGSTVTANDLELNSTVSAGSGYGIKLDEGSSVSLTGNSHISVSNTWTGDGVYVEGNSVFNADNISIDVSSSSGHGIYAQEGSTVALGEASIVSTGDSLYATGQGTTIKADHVTLVSNKGHGVNAQTNAHVDLGSGSSIEIHSNTGGYGIWAVNNAYVAADHITIQSTGSSSSNAAVAQNGSTIDIGAGSHTITDKSHGIVAMTDGAAATMNFKGGVDDRNTITAHSQSGAYAQGLNAVVNIENTDIVMDGTMAGDSVTLGLWAFANGTINMKNSSISVVEGGAAVYAMNGGKANLSGETVINGGSNSQSALATQGKNSLITVRDKAIINGNIFASGAGSLIDINVDKGSVFTGYSTIDTNTPTAKINLQMTNGMWNMTNSSVVNNLTLNNTAVNFTNTDFKQLTADTLQGNGLFNLKTDIIGQQSDLIIINEKAEGSHQLNITNNGSAATDGTETLTVVQVNGQNNATFALTNKVELGAYEYDLQASGNDMILTGSLQSNGSGTLTSTAQAASSFLNIGYLTNYIENQTLLQRLGDLRNNAQGNTTQDGLWIKEYGGKLNSFAGHTLERFRMTYTGTQLGIDKQLDIQNGNLILGAMAGYTRTNPNYRQGNGTGKNYTAGLYATYYQDNGLYLDTVLKYNSMRNHFSVKDTAGNNIKGTGKTQGISLSTELGKRYWLTNQHQGLYIEPQAQLTYGYQNGDTVHANNGLKIGLSHYNSTLGRVSGILGYQTQGETPVNVYLKTGVVREMSGGTHYRYNNGTKNSHSFRSNWIDNGIGINVNIKKQHNLYAEADYATGNQFDNAKLDIGYRYNF